MDWFSANEMINKPDESFWKSVLEEKGVKPAAKQVNRLKSHFFYFLYRHSKARFESFNEAWNTYADSGAFNALVEAFKEKRYERVELKDLLRTAFGSLSGLKSSVRREIQNVMAPLVAAGLVDHRVIRGGGHFWQPAYLESMALDDYLEMLTERYFEMRYANRKDAA